MRYVELEDLYAAYRPIATTGQTDEQLRKLIEDSEQIVEADLRRRGFRVPIESEAGKAVVRDLVLSRVISILSVSEEASGRYGASLSQYHDRLYYQKLDEAARRLAVIGEKMEGAPHLPRGFQPERSGLRERVRRWID